MTTDGPEPTQSPSNDDEGFEAAFSRARASMRATDEADQARRKVEKLREVSLRKKWRDSPEYRQWRKERTVVGCIFLTFLIFLITFRWGWDAWAIHKSSNKLGDIFFYAGIVAALLYVDKQLRRDARQNFDDRMLLEEERERDFREAQLVAQDETDIKELWKLTNDRLRGYHERAYRQADQSFRNAQIAIFGGFVIVAGTAAIAAWKTSLSTPSSVVVGVVGTVGAGLAAYIGRTFLRLQETTASHMRSYFDQPQETFRYLVAEKLIERLPEDQRAATVNYLVQAVMLSGVTVEQAQAALNAQQQNGQTDPPGQAGGNAPRR